MNEMNEKLAELCGFVQFNKSKCPGCELSADRQRCAFDQGSDCPRLNMPDYIDAKGRMVFAWNPTADLNQLKMCYEALSKDEKESFAFNTRYAPTDRVFTNPELVAQDILKAKGVI